jgi:DNA-3-methyladenine glycosylase
MVRGILDSMKRLNHAFFRQDAERLARGLIGTILVRRRGGREYRARIVETEAYVGPRDLACHTSRGRTKRTEVMFGPAGHAYVYLIYGMHRMFNIVAGRAGSGQAVLLRAAEPLDGWKADLSGPGRFTRAFRITGSMNGTDLTGDGLHFLSDPDSRPRIRKAKRIGVEYAGVWKDRLLRFYDDRSAAVTHRPAR